MNKLQVIKEKKKLSNWCESLKDLSDEVWFMPIREGSWGIADVMSHFITWDQFLLENRLPYINSSDGFPTIKVDVEAMNAAARSYARSGITRGDLINEFIEIRKKLVSHIETIPTEKFSNSFSIGKSNVTLNDYFTGLIEHDNKHRVQIDTFLKSLN